MPKDTKSLVTSRYIPPSPNRMDRLRELKKILMPYAVDKKDPKFKGYVNCCKFARRHEAGRSNVSIECKKNKVSLRGTNPCGSYDCPYCADFNRRIQAEKLSKSVQACLWDGGSVDHVTSTKAPEIDDKLSIDQVLRYVGKSMSWVDRYNRRKGTSIGYWSTIEQTISTNIMVQDHAGVSCSPKLYLNIHTHSLFLCRREDLGHRDAVLNGLKNLWAKTITGAGGKTFAGTDVELEHRAWYVEPVTEDKGIAQYVNKLINPTDNLSCEMTRGHEKGIQGNGKTGRGLFVALDRIISKECGDWERKEIKRLIETWFLGMFRRNRVKRNIKIMNEFELRFEQIRKSVITKYHDRVYGSCDDIFEKQYKAEISAAFCTPVPTAMEIFNFIYTKLDDLVAGRVVGGWFFPLHSLQKEREADETEPDWVVTINGRLWDYFGCRGYEAMVVDIVVGYMNRDQGKADFDLLMKINRDAGRVGLCSGWNDHRPPPLVEQGVDDLVKRRYNDGVSYTDTTRR